MSVFHGDWNEDPKEFLNSYIQCTAAGGDKFKARQFINYLGAGSDADEWYDELTQEEKKDWAAIEISFRKRWLKEEVLDIVFKESVTIENKPEPASESIHLAHPMVPTILPTSSINNTNTQMTLQATVSCTTTDVFVQTNVISTQTSYHHDIAQQPSILVAGTLSVSAVTTETKIDTRISQPPEIDSLTCLITSQTPQAMAALFESWKNTKFGEIISKFGVFSSQKPSITAANSLAPSNIFTALETHSTTVGFMKNHQKTEKSGFLNQTVPETPPPVIYGPKNDVTHVQTSLPTHDDVDSQLPNVPALKTTASSAQTPEATRHVKSAITGAVFESQSLMDSLAPTIIISDLKMHPTSSDFTENSQKIENHTRSPKWLVLNEIATDFQATTTNGTPFIPAIHVDKETARLPLPFPPFHNLFVATSHLPSIFDYLISASNSTFKKSTPSSGKDPPYSLSSLYHFHTTHKTSTISETHFNTVLSTFFVLSLFYTLLQVATDFHHTFIHIWIPTLSFCFAFYLCSCFWATRALPCLKGGTWSIGPLPFPPSHIT